MKSPNKLFFISAFVFSIIYSCKKNQVIENVASENTVDTSVALKSATDVTIGVAVPFSPMLNDPKFAHVVRRDFDAVTFENEMKHYAIVQSDGSFNFTRTDALFNAATAAGLEVFGHTLGWHHGQNAGFLKSYAGITQTSSNELLGNPGFESGLTEWAIFNSGNPAGTSIITSGSGSIEVRSGSGSLKVVNPVGYPGNQWSVQVASNFIATNAGKQYLISYWVKSTSAGGSIRLSTGTNNGAKQQYQGDQQIGAAWQQVSWTITANAPQTRFLFDMGQVAATYFIDDVSVREVVQSSAGAAVGLKVDEALKMYISTIVGRYKGKVKAWDVINELFSDSNGAVRNNSNTQTTDADVFVWSNYLGRAYAYNAFKYAREADPAALLFINDYNLETNNTKLDSLISFVGELNNKGIHIDGIGTQMHIGLNTPRTNIDNMFRKLALTGLLIRISELDVRVNTTAAAGFVFSAAEATSQAAMYKYVIKSYLSNIPKAQQHGITFWGLTDNTSWLYKNGQDYPLLYKADMSKKPAYTAVLQALKGL